MCDMIPNAEHWRTPLWQVQQLQLSIMGYLPGFATPRFVCDTFRSSANGQGPSGGPLDRNLGISYWSKNYRTVLDGRMPML